MRVGSSDISMKTSNYRKYYMNIDGKMKTAADIRNHIRISNNIKDNIAKIILQVNGLCLKPSDNYNKFKITGRFKGSINKLKEYYN